MQRGQIRDPQDQLTILFKHTAYLMHYPEYLLCMFQYLIGNYYIDRAVFKRKPLFRRGFLLIFIARIIHGFLIVTHDDGITTLTFLG